MTFKALLTSKANDRVSTQLVDFEESDLADGDVFVQVDYSTLNYKDALALTGKQPIIQRFPLIPGIDFAGTVIESTHADWVTGDRVLVNGWGLSVTHHGGLAQRARVPGEWLVRVPESFSTFDAMSIGTAGFTAMLCVLALENGGIAPTLGDILVTGANGGVGSIALAILANLGYRTVAATGRPEQTEYLRALGASDVIDRKQFAEPRKSPLGEERWAGVIDVAGSHTLVNAIAETKYRGVVAACGVAHGNDLPGSLLPFIRRNVTLAGIDSVKEPRHVRQQAWNRLEKNLSVEKLGHAVKTIGLSDVFTIYTQIIPGLVRGRIVVDVNA